MANTLNCHFTCCFRDTSFEWNILQATGGHGVDIVLNSLSGEMLQASLNCMAQHGHFLEIGKFDMSNNTSIGKSVATVMNAYAY